jgi:G2/mitotic-specific cyclin 1/2
MEVTLLDYRFIRAKPSFIAAVGMYIARRMLDGDWVGFSLSLSVRVRCC